MPKRNFMWQTSEINRSLKSVSETINLLPGMIAGARFQG